MLCIVRWPSSRGTRSSTRCSQLGYPFRTGLQGVTSETAGSSENDITFNDAIVMLFLDMIIFAALAWYAGKVRFVLAVLSSFSLFDNHIIPTSGAKRPLIVRNISPLCALQRGYRRASCCCNIDTLATRRWPRCRGCPLHNTQYYSTCVNAYLNGAMQYMGTSCYHRVRESRACSLLHCQIY